MEKAKIVDRQKLIEIISDLDLYVGNHFKEEPERKMQLYCIGGTAMTLYGDKEASKDIDFILNYEDYKTFDEIEPEVSKKHEVPIDYFVEGWVIGYKLPEDFREKSEKVNLDSRSLEIYLISLADLTITKILAGRPNDMDDLGKIVRNHPEIRRGVLEDRFSLLKIHKTGEGLSYGRKFISFLDEFFPES